MTPRINKVYKDLFSLSNYERPQATIIDSWYYGEVIEVINENDIKVFIPGIDDELKKETIPNVQPLLTTLFHCVPEIGDIVKVFLKCPWDFQTQRHYGGPLMQYNDLFSHKDLALINKSRAGICFYEVGDIRISSDFQKTKDNENIPSMTLKKIEEQIKIAANDILLESYNSKLNRNEIFSVIYGERLMEFLLYIIRVLKTHSHGPNSPAIPDFHMSIDEWTRKIKDGYLINDKVKTR